MLSNPYENLTKYCFILSYYDGNITKYYFKLSYNYESMQNNYFMFL